MEFLISPAGSLRPDGPFSADDGAAWQPAFAAGNGAVLLRMLREDTPSVDSVSGAFLRRAAREFMTRLCRSAGEASENAFDAAFPDAETRETLLFARPPMTGGEYLNTELFERWFRELSGAAQREFSDSGLTLPEWVRELNPAWRDVGRVSFHLAENKNDPDGRHPFLFLATFIHRLSDNDAPKHLPLGAALKAYSQDREALTALLNPVRRAAEQSEFIAALFADNRIYQPVALSAGMGYQFLRDVPCFEAAGIVVRMVRLWGNRPPRLKLTVSLDAGRKHGFLAGDALLNFSVNATLGGAVLTSEELSMLLASEGGLVRVKGQWVEADPVKIAGLLAAWGQGGRLSAAAGLRMLAGADPGVPGLPAFDPDFCQAEAVGELKAQLLALASPGNLALPPLPEELAKILRPYQLAGVKFLWGMTRLGLGPCLADDMGLGKTLQVLSYLELLRRESAFAELPALLVAPASLLENWRSEAEKFTPQIRFGKLHGSALEQGDLAAFRADPAGFLSAFDLVATTYQTLQRLPELQTLEFPAIIADEAQALKNPEAKQSRAVRALKGARRIALTGTPVENRLSDLWSIFDFTSPGLLGSLKSFLELTRKLTAGEGAPDYAPLRRLTAPCILRRMKNDRRIIRDLPEKTEVNVFCPLAKRQAALYSEAVNSMRRELEAAGSEMEHNGVVLKYLMQFKQICNHPAQFTGRGEYSTAESGKFVRLAELAESIASRQEKTLVFTQFRELIDPLLELLAGVFGRPGLALHGGISLPRRAQLVEAFQQESGPPFFVLSLKAAGTGLNLTAADHVIHFDRWWNPAVENQATDRAYRIGRHRNVLVHKFICGGTIEERIHALIWSKRALSDALLREGAEKRLTAMNSSELLEFVKLDVNSCCMEVM